MTGADGGYRIDQVFAAQYQAQFIIDDWTRVQWAYGKNRIEDADVFHLVGDAETVVNDRLLDTGSIRVRATDAVTGAPVTGLCAGHGPAAGNLHVCTTETELVLNGYPAGWNEIFVYSYTGTTFRSRRS